jgi:hypothetical protein
MTNRTNIERESNTNRTDFVHLERTRGINSNVQLAEFLGVSEGTIRKWHAHCCNAVPAEWLKVAGKHTALSAALLQDYSDRVYHGDLATDAWIVEVRGQFPTAPPVESTTTVVDTTTALVTNDRTSDLYDAYLAKLDGEVQAGLAQLDQLDAALDADEMALFQQEMEAARQKGAKKAVMLHAIERQAQNETAQSLLQREIQRKTGGQG